MERNIQTSGRLVVAKTATWLFLIIVQYKTPHRTSVARAPPPARVNYFGLRELHVSR
jgi:hypothetical protein